MDYNKYHCQEWEQIGENLYRRAPSQDINIGYLFDIEMINYYGTYISVSEYDEIIFASLTDTYETLMQEELAKQPPFRKTLESALKIAKNIFKRRL